jgi:hypothetical protein
VDNYDMPFRQKGYSPYYITNTPSLYSQMSIFTDSGYNLIMPLLYGNNDNYYIYFSTQLAGGNSLYAFYGIHPAPFGAADGDVYLAVHATLSNPWYYGAVYLAEYYDTAATTVSQSLPYACVSNTNWSDYRPDGCGDCGSSNESYSTSCEQPQIPSATAPQTMRWRISFNDDTQSWSFKSGVTDKYFVIVYPQFSSFPVHTPFGVPYPAITNDPFYNSEFNIFNHSTNPPTVVYPSRISVCTGMPLFIVEVFASFVFSDS